MVRTGMYCTGPGKKSAFMANPSSSADILLHILEERRYATTYTVLRHQYVQLRYFMIDKGMNHIPCQFKSKESLQNPCSLVLHA